MQRRVECTVNKHMADIAVETLQRRLSAVSEEMHSLAEHVSGRSGEMFRDESRRGEVSLGTEPPPSSACSSGAADKLISAPSAGNHLYHPTAKHGSSLSLSERSDHMKTKLMLAIKLALFEVGKYLTLKAMMLDVQLIKMLFLLFSLDFYCSSHHISVS